MNKLIWLLCISLLIIIPSVIAGDCTSTNYDNCYEYSYKSSYAKTEVDEINAFYSTNGNAYIKSDYELRYKCTGDKAYLYDYNNFRDSYCDETGCRKAITTLPIKGTIKLGDYLPLTPLILCWDYYSNPERWSWSYSYYSWYDIFYELSFSCISDTDCLPNEYCKLSTPKEYDQFGGSRCVGLICKPNEKISNHLCVPKTEEDLCKEGNGEWYTQEDLNPYCKCQIGYFWNETSKKCEEAECSEIKACPGNIWKFDTSNPESKILTRNVCTNNKCLSETKEVECRVDSHCENWNTYCDTKKFTCKQNYITYIIIGSVSLILLLVILFFVFKKKGKRK